MIILFPRRDMLIPWKVTIKQMPFFHTLEDYQIGDLSSVHPINAWFIQGPQAFVPVHAASPAKLLGAPTETVFWGDDKLVISFENEERFVDFNKNINISLWKTDLLPAGHRIFLRFYVRRPASKNKHLTETVSEDQPHENSMPFWHPEALGSQANPNHFHGGGNGRISHMKNIYKKTLVG